MQGGACTFENLLVCGFPGNTFDLNSTVYNSGAFGTIIKNCFHFVMGGSGCYLSGGNAGESLISLLQGWYCRGWHFRDDTIGELKKELADANTELDRIKKRLGDTPKKPPTLTTPNKPPTGRP